MNSHPLKRSYWLVVFDDGSGKIILAEILITFIKSREFSPGFFCPGEEAALGIIVVSLPCTAYLCGALTAFCSLG